MARGGEREHHSTEDQMPGEWQVNLSFMTEHFKLINEQLDTLKLNIKAFEEYAAVSRKQLEYLNSWHNKVTGALWVLGGLGSASFATCLVILSAVLSR